MERVEKNNKIYFSEILFLAFWVIMLFVKGVGLYDGQMIYNVLFVAAFLCLIVKFMYTEHTYSEWLFIILFNLIGLVVYMHSKEKGVLICTMMISSMKNVSLERVAKSGLFVWSLSMGGRLLLSLIMLDSTQIAIQNKSIIGYVCRYYLGFPHPNTLHISYFFLVALVFFALGKKVNLKVILGLLGGNLVLFLYSFSLTGFLISLALIALGFYAVKKENLNHFEYGVIKLWYPVCLLISLGVPMVMGGKLEEILNFLLNNRFMLSRKYLSGGNITLLGIEVGKISTTKQAIDNSFVHGLLSYGVILFLILSVFYIFMVFDFVKKKRDIELMVFVVCFLGGLTEPYLFNTSFKNITLIFLGYYIYSLNIQSRFPILNRKWKLLRDKEYSINLTVFDNVKNHWKRGKNILTSKTVLMTVVLGAVVSVVYLQFYNFRAEILGVNSKGILIFESVRVFVTTTLMVTVILQTIYKVFRLKIKKD